MSDLSGGLMLKQPLSAWNRSVNTDFRQLFKSLGKAATQGLFGQWEKAALSSQDAVSAVGLEGQKPEVMAYLLIHRALTLAMFELTSTVSNRFDGDADLEAFADELDMAFEDNEFEINSRFFDYPWELGILEILREPFAHFLVGAGVTEVEATSASQRLARYFTSALHAEWRLRADVYRPLLDTLKGSPFAQADERERRWIQYSARLDLQLDEQVFDEAFGIRQVYIPLRAYWKETKEGRNHAETEIRHVVDLEQHLTGWVDAADQEDAARVISGGPGSGKSVFCKFFAAKMARREELRVVLVPLHRFDPRKDLVKALCEFASRNRLIPDDLLNPDSEERLLVIFDGLDELAEQGKVSHRVAGDFVRELRATLDAENQDSLRLQILLSGRELAIQTHESGLRRDTRIMHLIGYLPVEAGNGGQVEGPEDLLKADQRDDWWRRFGEAIGESYEELPKDLATASLNEITKQPLLNYLLALSYIRKKLDFSTKPNLNKIYEDLLAAVHDRGWGPRKGHPTTDELTLQDFVRILEEIALSTWHGDGRKTTIRQIQEKCKLARIGKHLELFEEGAKEGVTQLLTAFYFRQGGHNKAGDRVFEFTHKSFGEYLTARRIVRLIGKAHDWLDEDKDPEDGLGEEEVLVHWARVCGPSEMDQDLNKFLRAEVTLKGPETCTRWQGTVTRLISHLLRHQMPMTNLGMGSFREMKLNARNAEEALLAAHSACALVTNEVGKINWPQELAAGTWICQLSGQRPSSGGVGIAVDCLNSLDLAGQGLCVADLYAANLREAKLQEADLYGADLQKASLQHANLQHAKLLKVDLQNANLQNANLQFADLQNANLQFANLQGTDLSTAKDLAQALNLDTTIGNAKTKLPKGFPRPKSWDK